MPLPWLRACTAHATFTPYYDNTIIKRAELLSLFSLQLLPPDVGTIKPTITSPSSNKVHRLIIASDSKRLPVLTLRNPRHTTSLSARGETPPPRLHPPPPPRATRHPHWSYREGNGVRAGGRALPAMPASADNSGASLNGVNTGFPPAVQRNLRRSQQPGKRCRTERDRRTLMSRWSRNSDTESTLQTDMETMSMRIEESVGVTQSIRSQCRVHVDCGLWSRARAKSVQSVPLLIHTRVHTGRRHGFHTNSTHIVHTESDTESPRGLYQAHIHAECHVTPVGPDPD